MKIGRKEVQFVIGFLLAVASAFLMWKNTLLGESTALIASGIGIVGIILIVLSFSVVMKL